jgi:hypothetical protein
VLDSFINHSQGTHHERGEEVHDEAGNDLLSPEALAAIGFELINKSLNRFGDAMPAFYRGALSLAGALRTQS